MKRAADFFQVKNNVTFFVFSLFTIIAPLLIFGQNAFDKTGFATRRAKVFEKIGDNLAIIFGNGKHPYAVKFRQSPDFYYLTGIEEPDAILLLDGKNKRTFIFAQRIPADRAIVEGAGLLNTENAAAIYGVNFVLPFEEFYLRLGSLLSNGTKLYLPLTPPDDLQYARDEMILEEVDGSTHPLFKHPVRYKEAVSQLKKWCSNVQMVDVNPILDDLRWVKTPYEIERLRMSGKIGAEGIKEAMKGTKPGMYEYELEATARFVYIKRGARGDAFIPIVASGSNTLILHYTKNSRLMQAGDIVLMDYGADYDYYTSDITRTWAVSGEFTPEQEQMYRCILEARNAIIAVMKPGITVKDMEDAAQIVYKKYGLEKEFLASGRYVGHFVGLSVHDVGSFEKPFVPGVVFNVEPLIQSDKLKIHMRIEDTILITAQGAENLTAGVPVELNEIYALAKQQPISISQK